MKYFFATLTLLIASVITFFGARSIWHQHRAITTFISVDAEITSAKITRHSHSKGGATYTPDISYQYRYQSHLYHASSIFPTSTDGNQTWANSILSQFQSPAAPIGKDGLPQVHAFIDAQNPSDAILLKQYAAGPYVLANFGLLGIGIGLGLLTGVIAGGRKQMAAVALDDSAWRLLLPIENLHRQFVHAALWCAWIILAAWLPLFHWYFAAKQIGAYGALMGFFAILVSLAFAAFAVMRWNVTRHMSDARLRVSPAPMQRGEPVALELEADVYRPLSVAGAKARLLCVEHYKERYGNKTTYGTRTCFERSVALAPRATFDRGQALQFKSDVTSEKTAMPTTDISQIKGYPYYTWEIRVHIELEKAPDYRATFPLEVD